MSTKIYIVILCVLTLVSAKSALADDGELDGLRSEIALLRADYETRIAALEERLAAAERAQATPQGPPLARTRSNSAYNPAIGVIFQGQAWSFSEDPNTYSIPGFPLAGEAGPFDEGLATGEAELNISANVDDKFTAWLTAALLVEDGEGAIEIEEAWIETTALPGGLSARFGRFFSGIGYLNSKHSHSWDFADQPLPYQAFFGGQYLDDGLQLRWIAPTDIYIEVGAEVFRGSRYPAAGAANSGSGANSFFVNFGGDVGRDHSWLAGVSRLNAKSIDRESGVENAPLLFSGDSGTTIAQFVYKWSPNGNWKQRNLIVSSEFFWRSENGDFTIPGGALPATDIDQRGSYIQAVYQPFPRWRFGTRADWLSGDTPFVTRVDDPRRFSLMTDWSNSEFSRLRLQYTRDEAGFASDDQWGIQYILSIGAHGGHSF